MHAKIVNNNVHLHAVMQ